MIENEIHAPLVLPGAKFVPYLSVPGAEDAFSVLSASKAWNLAGLKAALAIAGPEAQAHLERMPEEGSHGASHFEVMARTQAFSHGGRAGSTHCCSGSTPRPAADLQFLSDRIPELRCGAQQGTYPLWIDCRSLGMHDEAAQGRGCRLGARGTSPATSWNRRGWR